MSKPTVLVLGSSFGGLTAALAVKHELHDEVDVTVVSASDQFVFNPSLIWVPFGKRSLDDISFPVAPTFAEHGVEFVHATVTELDLDGRQVHTTTGSHGYDYLVIATGYRNDFEAVPGTGPDGPAGTITTAADALDAGDRWRRFLAHPGDVVIGATQGASCFGAAYEYLFNISYQLKKAGLKKDVRLTYVTAEPFLGHFGIGGLPHGESLLGMFMRKEGIEVRLNASMDRVDDGKVVLADGDELPFAYAMIVPPFKGQDVVKAATAISDDKGYVPVRGTYQSEPYDNVYAVGIAAAVAVPWQTPAAVGIPKTGFPTETQAHTAATNIVAQIKGEEPAAAKPFGDIPAVCIMDAGNNGVLILADKMLPPRKRGVLVPGPQSHAMKLAFEKYFLWKTRHGYVSLP